MAQEKEFLAKGASGRKVELDEIVDPELEIPSGATEDVLELSSTSGVEQMMMITSRSLLYLTGQHDHVPLLNGTVILSC